MHNISSEELISVDPPWDEGQHIACGSFDCDFPLVAQALSSMLALIREQLGMDVIFVSDVADAGVSRVAENLRMLCSAPIPSAAARPVGAHIGVPVLMPDGSICGTLFAFANGRAAKLAPQQVRRLEVAAHATARLLAQAAGHELVD